MPLYSDGFRSAKIGTRRIMSSYGNRRCK